MVSVKRLYLAIARRKIKISMVPSRNLKTYFNIIARAKTRRTHQVRIIEEDQPALRFLWRNLELQRTSDVYQMLVMIFGAALSTCMANYVFRKTALDIREDVAFSADTIKSVENNFYMDDFLKSVCDEATAVRMFREMTSLLVRGAFRVTKWIISSREVLSQILLKRKLTRQLTSVKLGWATNWNGTVRQTVFVSLFAHVRHLSQPSATFRVDYQPCSTQWEC